MSEQYTVYWATATGMTLYDVKAGDYSYKGNSVSNLDAASESTIEAVISF